MPVSIVTDSAASLPHDLVSSRHITVVPMILTLDGDTFRDGELSLDAVVERSDRGFATAAPSPGQFLEAIERVDDGDGVVVLTVATTMSSAFDAAHLAARQHDGTVEVVDTGTAAGGEALVVLAAADAATAGLDTAGVVAAARDAAARIRLVAVLGSLDHLARSGRVPDAAALAGRWLHLCALFEFKGGRARPLRPARSRAAALDHIVERWRADTEPKARLHVAALHAGEPEPAEALLARVRAASASIVATAFVAPFSAVMVAHTGPDLVGLSWWWEPPVPANDLSTRS